MLYKIGDFFVTNFRGERLFIWIDSNKTWIQASNGIIISEYVKSDDYAELLQYLSEQ